MFIIVPMHRLTSKLLDNYPYSRHATQQTIQRGRAYYKDGNVWDVTMPSDQNAVCMVDGDTGEYTVEIEIDKKSGELSFECDCYYAEEGNFCKHMVAAALEVSEFLRDEEEDEDEIEPKTKEATGDWKTKLMQSVALMPRQSAGGSQGKRYAVAVILERDRYNFYNYGGHSPYSYSLEPFVIKENEWNPLLEIKEFNPEQVNHLLETSKNWIKTEGQYYPSFSPKGCLNLTQEALSFVSLLFNVTRMYGGQAGNNLSNILPMLAKFDIPIFLGKTDYQAKIERRLRIQPEPIQIQIDMQQDEKKLSLQAGFDNNGTFTHIQKKIEVMTNNPTWVFMDDTIAQIENSRALEILSAFPIEIPNQQVDIFREQYFPLIAQALPIKSDLVKYQDVHADAVPRLYLHDDNKEKVLRATLQFGYGDYNSPLAKDEPYALASVPDTWELVRVHRQPEREEYFYQLLTDPIYRLKRAGSPHPHGTLELRARAHPYDFLMHSIPALLKAGFEIYGEENLKTGRINRNTATLRVQISSGIDWFDLKTVVEFGDQQVNFHDIRKALKRKENYIKLADGSIGQIPQEWLEKYKHLWGLAEETEDGFRVSDLHLSLIDSLLEDDASIQTPPDLLQRRERFRHFERIAPLPLPKGFTGELRPYQKHGFDWLHFLREYKFGGILADDMGLGKTVQVLTYLQSLQEQAKAESAALLVVPKSLIANWQRESEKFTPSLRFLEYMGNFRNKDVSIFDEYDVVITTYGTMLRDIEILHKYNFNHIILDESQAIKNPLAKSAKAARLLNAEHRIVMTGTPVENNTFELWSQFAFLNPGLLGSMDYFKKEFANPIEAAGDEKTAETLRKLVYPFILRRTKEQVALELPPRTERIVYTDMDTAQKKLYTQTRERYRAELLGLIESEGMNNARFKVLEGLLRLRQIAIHPALVDKTYKGESPKFEILLETLETLQAENHKALIFSQFVETLKLVKKELDARKIKYIYLDGQTQKRQDKVDEFQTNDAIPFFLISLKAGGVGLNLTAADYVIHLDPWWNPAVEMQASDRAHRIGQTRPVFVYKIIARGTVEEKILELQEKKRALVKNIIATEASFFKSLTRDDVKGLFE
ncbi:MAG: SNF2 helicase associated domain-containing protein [Chloroflexi bacterium]|nr:SNF2 helicase associated domain-containing protein [Chloroflexota bacterium]